MIFPHQLLPGAIADLYAAVSETGMLSQGDRYGLQAAILTDEISPEERDSINRLLRAVARRRVAVH